MSEETLFPRSSAFEPFLAKVYMELWDLQDVDRAKFARRVNQFVRTWMTVFRAKLPDKLPGYEAKLERMETAIKRLEQMKVDADPFTVEAIDKSSIPEEEAELAEEVWAAAMDVFSDAGFNATLGRRVERREMMR